MAEEILKPEAGNGKGARRTKKLSTKVDLTPMVDLGFLLITFFILTKTLSDPKQVDLFLPAGEKKVMNLGESTALTLIPLGNDKILYYNGDPNDALTRHLYEVVGDNGIRSLIMKKQLALNANPTFKRTDLFLIIKPTKETEIKNIGVVLDEVLINQLEHYTMVDLEKEDVAMLDKLSLPH